MKAFYAGSFDPFTKGHLAVCLEIFANCDELVIGVGTNREKNLLFQNPEKRIELINHSIDDIVYQYKYRKINNIKYSANEQKALEKIAKGNRPSIISYSGLTIYAAAKSNANWLFRGERIVGDHDAEMALAEVNNDIANIANIAITQAFIPVPKLDFTKISSSGVKGACKERQFIMAYEYVMPIVHNEMMKIYLKKEFEKLCNDFGLEDADIINSLFKELVDVYSDISRKYHNLSHLAYGLNLLDIQMTMSGKVEYFNPILRLAWFYHDFVNGTSSNNDEELSAQVVARVIDAFPLTTLKNSTKSSARELIMLTKHNINPFSVLGGSLMSDLDLGILGDPKNYGFYAQYIFEEYKGWEDIDKYAKGRSMVLSKLLSKDKIFCLDVFARRESIARENMERELNFWKDYKLSNC